MSEIETPISDFVADGFLVVRGAVAPDVVRECCNVIEDELRALSVDTNDPSTWTNPVVRIPCPDSPVFTAAGTSPALWRMYDALLGPGSWVQRQGVGGTIPIRFPSTTNPGDAGWHIDGSYEVDGQYWVNVHSRYRGLLALFLSRMSATMMRRQRSSWDLIWISRAFSHRMASAACFSAMQ